MTFCAIDFGTSNSAVAVPSRTDGMVLAPLEGEAVTMPTAVFYFSQAARPDGAPSRAFGRAALAAYVEGQEGRLMRSMKSLLGSSLMTQSTDIGEGRAVRYADMLVGYLQQLRACATAALGEAPTRAVLGRPVHFVDDDPERDAAAQQALAEAAHSAGFEEVVFAFEPIAAALDFEQRVDRETRVLVADIGGGTSDFSLVRVGPQQRCHRDRRDDILAHHGVHTAGTDFDRHLSLATVMRTLGHGSMLPPRPGSPAGAAGRPMPSNLYFDLATWHLIPTVYAPATVADWRRRKPDFVDPRQHARLMTVLQERLGHGLAATVEDAKMALAQQPDVVLSLAQLEAGLTQTLSRAQAQQALASDIARIVAAARETVRRAGLGTEAVDALYLTGGSTGLLPLAQALQAAFPSAEQVQGERFASVATGLGLQAARVFGAAMA